MDERRVLLLIGTVIFLVSGIGALIGSAYSAIHFPERRDDLHALRDAPVCESPLAPTADCRWAQEFVVSDIQLYDGRRSHITAMLTTPNQGYRWRAEFRRDGPLLESLRDGDRVTGTIWRGEVVEIAARNVEQATIESPTTMAETELIFAVVLGPTGLLLVYTCGWRLVRWSYRGPATGMYCVFGLAVALVVAGLLAAAYAGRTTEGAAPELDTKALWIFAAGYGGSAAIMALIAVVMYRAIRPRELDTSCAQIPSENPAAGDFRW